MPCALNDPGGHRERALVGDEIGCKHEWQRAEIFQEEGNADGGDQRGDARRIAQRFVGDALDGEGQEGAGDHREQDDRDRAQSRCSASTGMPGISAAGQGVQSEAGDGIVAGKSADHEDVAVGEVDQADDAVHHRVAQGNQGVNKSNCSPLTTCWMKTAGPARNESTNFQAASTCNNEQGRLFPTDVSG